MKKFILSILLGILTGNTHAQDDITLFFLNDGTFKGFYDEEIDSITYSHLDLDSIWHSDAVVQDIWLADSVVRIPIETIDSICHKVPEPVYKSNVIRLDERYLPYIVSVNGMTINFSPYLPDNLRPHQGDVLVYEGTSEIFPVGFAGKVVTEGSSVVCEEAEIPDIYDKFVFFGSYIMQQIPDETVPSYTLRRIKNRTQKKLGNSSHIRGHEDDIDWRSGGFKADDIGIGTIKRAYKIELKKIHTQVGAEISVTPVISIELYWDSYVYSPYLFYKRTVNVNYDNKYLVKYSRDTKPESDAQKSFWNSFWKGVEPSWFDTTYGYMDDPNDDEDTQSLYVIDEEVPLPDCPLLKVGVQLGIFCQPKLEGVVSIGFETSGNIEKTYIYSSRNGSTESETKTSNNEFVLEGSVKGSLWAGLVAGLHVSLGLGKGKRLEGVEEEAKFKIGPYIEGEIKADFADAIADKSVYSLVKDSKVKTGWKLGLDCKFKAKLAGGLINFNWDQLSWSPKNLIDEHNIYFFPKFEAPSYTTDGNSLRCSSIVSRQTFSNKIGFVLLKEDGSEQDRKYLDESYSFMNDDVKYSNDEHPFSMTLTFDNLDFANHRYTIVPCTRLFGFECLGMQMPEEQHTVVLCPNSNHPHLIDMGLPSGTKWLCTNVYANAPKDAGGYYQWGKPYMVHAYTDATYRAPNFTMANYQGSEYDAATVNLGQEYCTPTMSQFLELHDNCSMDYKYSPWGNNVLGVFLKGKNGNNLYLPFSGFKSGVKVNNSSEGWYLSSDAVDNNNKPQRKAVVLKNDDVIWGSADALAYGHSVRPVSSRNDGLVFEQQQLDYEVYVGQRSGQSVTVTNNGSAAASITVAQTIAPFQVDDACLGTFTVNPKERLSVLVFFSPTEEKEYTSALTLSYEIGDACVVSKIPLYGKGIKVNNTQTETFTVNGVSFDMIAVEGGTFWMGAEDGDYEASSVERPRHEVRVDDYAIGQTEVTQQLWETVMGNNPSNWKGADLPVENVSWDECQTFITKLNALTGREFRLPTEAEWEFAARGGKNSNGYKYSGSNDIDAVAWYINNSDGKTHPVAQKAYNELGIYDMSGNVWEWCNDWYDEQYYSVASHDNPTGPSATSFHVRRGGRWDHNSPLCRVSSRNDGLREGESQFDGSGLRLALSDGGGAPIGYLTCPDSNHPHLIDLGLPSGTLWACCNIDTDSPEEFGGYYAWGELEEKDSYTTSNYSLSSAGSMHDLTAEEDVATVTWGSKWRMPTMDEFKEILNHCSWSWEEFNEVIGARITGPNGGTIFLPAASMKDDSQYTAPLGTYGSYWGRTHATSSSYATELVFGIAYYSQNYQLGEFYYEMGPTGTRQTGRSVRAVGTERYIDGNDYTIYITNPSFDDNYYGGWEGTILSGVNPDNNAEHYNKSYNTYQTITGLPAGKYKVGVQGFYRKGSPNKDYELWQSGDTANNNAMIYANSSEGSYSIPFVPASSAALPESIGGKAASVGNGLYIPDNMVAAGAWFAAGYYHNYLEIEVGSDGVLTIGIKKDTTIDSDWTIIDNWTLIRL